MAADPNIRYLQHHDIDPLKWNETALAAPNSRIYAQYEYLEYMAQQQWDALVMGNYEAVMPLPWRKRYGIHYLYQPAFTASGGVIGRELNMEIVSAFIRAIPSKFRLIELPLNSANDTAVEGTYLRQNFILPLNAPYAQISQGFRESTKRNIRRAEKICRISRFESIDEVIVLNKPVMSRISNLKERDYQNFSSCYKWLSDQGRGEILGVRDSGNQLVASAVFIFDRNRAYYIMVGNTPNGKTMGASHFLINSFIEQHAASQLILDFEGSDQNSLAFFYSSFGATCETYPALRINRLPALIRWLK